MMRFVKGSYFPVGVIENIWPVKEALDSVHQTAIDFKNWLVHNYNSNQLF